MNIQQNLPIFLLTVLGASLPNLVSGQLNSVGTNPAFMATLYSEGGEIANDRGTWFFVGRTSRGALRRAVIKASIPASLTFADVQEVRLTLEMDKSVSGPSTISLHRLTEDWTRGISDAPGEEGRGGPASPGSVTWIHTSYPDAFWTTPGGSFEPTPSASLVVDGSESYTWTGPGLIDDINFWREHPDQNFGWILIGDEENQSAKRFQALAPNNTSPRLNVLFIAVKNWASYLYYDDVGSVNTGNFIGWIDVSTAPWIYSYGLDKFIFLPEENVTPEGAWSYIPKPATASSQHER